MSPSSGFFYDPDVTVYDYNLEKARSILKQAGFKYRHSGQTLEDPQGHPVEFNLYTADAGTAGRVQMAAIIRSDLEKIGHEGQFSAGGI